MKNAPRSLVAKRRLDGLMRALQILRCVDFNPGYARDDLAANTQGRIASNYVLPPVVPFIGPCMRNALALSRQA
jgi:hypothetical protein